MISLKVEDKCQNCPYFHPDVERIDATTLEGKKNFIQTVYCENNDFCNEIEEYLKSRK